MTDPIIWRAEDIPDQYLDEILRLIEAGRAADEDLGEDLSHLSPEEIVKRLIS